MQPFRIDIPQAAVDDLHRRLDDTRCAPMNPAAGCPPRTSTSDTAAGSR